MKDRKGEIYKTEIPNNVIQHFLNTFKTSDSEIILDDDLNFKQIFKDVNSVYD